MIADYRNSYYGREASRALDRLGADRAAVLLASARREPALAIAAGTPPASAPLIQRLLAVGLYDDAIAEVQKAKLETGASPLLDATLAYALNRKGDLRGAIGIRSERVGSIRSQSGVLASRTTRSRSSSAVVVPARARSATRAAMMARESLSSSAM